MIKHGAVLKLLSIGVGFTAISTPEFALAQDAVTAATGDQHLEEVVVTARRREERLQSAPVTVDAVSATQLVKSNMTEASDVLKVVPGFTFNQSNPTQPEVFLRGMGSDIQSITADQAIGFFQDGVFLARSQAESMQMFDLDRVEVVKGPQGLEYGKNVAGGAVNFIPKRPTADPEAIITLGGGNYASTDVTAIVNGPINDELNGRLSFADRNHGGYDTNTLTGKHAEWQVALSARGQIDWKPNEDLDVLIGVDGTKNNGGGFWVYNAIPSRQDAPFYQPNPRAFPNNVNPRDTEEIAGGNVKVTWDSPFGVLTSLSAARAAVFENNANEGGSYINFAILPHLPNGQINFHAFNSGSINDDYYQDDKGERITTLSQELRFSSALTDYLSFTVGVYGEYESGRRHELENFVFSATPTRFFNPSFAGQNYVLTGIKQENYSAFLEATYKITDSISLLAGVRRVEVHKSENSFHSCMVICQSFGLLTNQFGQTVTSFDATAAKTWGATTPSATLSWQVTPEALLYALYSTGFKSGAWNDDNSSSTYAQAVKAYAPEHSENWEIGAKTDWFDRRLRVNLSGFLSDYTNLQTQQFVVITPNAPGSNVIANAGSAQVKGVELELTAIPVEGLLLSAHAVNQIGRITSDLFNRFLDANFVPHTDNLNGTTLRRTPHISYTVDATYTHSIGQDWEGFVNAEYQYTGAYYFQNDKNPLLDPYTLARGVGQINASIGMRSADNDWEVTAWGRNLTDRLVISGQTYILGSFLNWYLPPRTYGVNVTKRF
ncbi:MAG TPA: TonB-dependent receptor [Alphaproteobacteria bacterium]|nr:TonB-dependent receptor [Alphaproteobacteria bacterium]